MTKHTAQNPSPDTKNLLERIRVLETENVRLHEQLAVLSDHAPYPSAIMKTTFAFFSALPDTSIRSANTLFTELTGYGDNSIGCSLESCFSEDTAEAGTSIAARFHQSLKEHTTCILSGIFRCQDDSRIPVLLVMWPDSAADRADQPVLSGIVLEMGEIHKSRTIMEAERDQVYQAVLNNTQIGIVIVQDFRFAYVNDAFSSISGYTIEELLAMTPEQIHASIYEEDREMVWGRLQSRFSGDPVPDRYEFRVVTKSGAPRWLELTVNRIDYQGKPALFETMTDITERKQAEMAVMDSEKRLAQIVQGTSIASFVIDESHTVTHWNKACEIMSGIPAEDVIGTNRQWSAFYPKPRPVMADMVLDQKDAGEIKILYSRFSQKSPLIEGAYEAEDFFPSLGPQGKWLYFTAAPIRDANGRIIGAIETLQDITRRRIAEETLRENRELLNFAIEQMPIPVIIATAPHLEVMMMNTAAVSILDLTIDLSDPLSISTLSSLCRFVNADDTALPAGQFPLTRAITQGAMTRNTELQIIHSRDGSRAWISANAAPLVNDEGAIIAGIMIFPDITARKQQETALRESEERFRALINSSSDGIVIINRQGDYIEANETFQRMVGYSAEELLNLKFYEITPDKWHAREEEALKQIEIDGHGSFEKEYRAKDGTVVPVMVNCWKIPGTDPQGGHFGGFVRDISRELRMELQLRQTQKMEAIGTLAAGIAHDFNNALTSILMNTELLMSEIQKSDMAFAPLHDIHVSGIRAKELVEQILTFSRQSSQDRRPIQLEPIIKESLKILRASLPATIEIDQHIDAGEKTVYANPTQMHQVIINLMTNAAHAMKDTGGTLILSLQPRKLSKSNPYGPNTPPGHYMELTVSDTGHGMDQIVLERIFEPFYTTKGPGEGTGMGLAVVHGIITAMGGYITVDSAPNQGTSFHVLLPEYGREYDDNAISETGRLEGSEHILFIDDEPAINKVARLTLERLGYQVTTYDSSADGFRAFQDDPQAFDLIITDLTMPGMTGLELADTIKQIRSEIPIIVCSGYNEAFEGRDPAEFGIVATVKKPFSKVTLVTAIRTTMDT